MNIVIPRQTTPSPTSSSLPPASTGSSTSPPTATATSTTRGIFDFTTSSSPSPVPTTVRPPTNGGKQSVPQLVLEWIFALIAVGVLVLLLFCRYTSLRRRGRPVRELFSRGPPQRSPSPDARPFRHSIRHPYNHPRPLSDSNQEGIILPSQPLHSAIHSDALFTIPTLPQPGAHPRGRNRAVTGAGTDTAGRRLDSGDPAEGREYLPAYDSGRDGPPKYAELMAARMDAMEMVDLGSPSTEQMHMLGHEHSEGGQNHTERGDAHTTESELESPLPTPRDEPPPTAPRTSPHEHDSTSANHPS